jgi:D-ribose pyranose/furanose isomerase RbsD
MQKTCFFIHQKKTPFIYCESFSPKFSYAKKKNRAMLKKYVHAKKHEKKREIHAKEHEEKKRKITHISKAIVKKGESHDQRNTKNI